MNSKTDRSDRFEPTKVVMKDADHNKAGSHNRKSLFLFMLKLTFVLGITIYFVRDITSKFTFIENIIPYPNWVIPILVAAIMIFHRSIKKRWSEEYIEEAREVALRLGKEYMPAVSSINGFSTTPLFKSVKNGSLIHVLKGENDLVFILSYVIATKNESNASLQKSTVYQTVAGVSEPGRNLPTFQLTPEGFFEKFSIVTGGQDIDFEEDQQFSKTFRLQGADETLVRCVFSEPALRLELLRHSQVSLMGQREWLWIYKFGKISPQEFSSVLQQAHQISNLFEK